MPKISSATIDEVNSRTDIVALIGEYTQLENRGGDWWGCCPFHNEKTPSFHVLPDRKMYHCFGCGAGGGVINFFMEAEKLDFIPAVEALAKKNGIEVIYDSGESARNPQNSEKDEYILLYTRVANSFHYLLMQSDAGKFARAYLKERGIADETAEQFQLGYAPADRRWLKKFLTEKNYSRHFLENSGLFSKKYPDVSFFSDRLMFPICDRSGKVLAFGGRILQGEGPKYLNSGDLVQYKKGETIYAFHLAKQHIREQKTVIFCEGYMDVIAYHQAGIRNAVAPLGTALTAAQIKLVQPFVDSVFLSFDSDKAGQNATQKAILLCREMNLPCRVIRLAQGKDPAEILLNYGAEVLKKNVDCAIIDADYLLSFFSEMYPIDTPDGKTKTALSFFPYIAALKSDIQKESCFEQLARVLSLKTEAVKADFYHQDAARERIKRNVHGQPQNTPVKLNAELRAVLAVAANLKFYPMMRSALTADDFDGKTARNLFIILEECYRNDAVSYDALLAACDNDLEKKLITRAVMSGEFSGEPALVKQIVQDCINSIHRRSLEKKRGQVQNRIRLMTVATLDDKQQLEKLLVEKMNIDVELRKKDADK
ncbi:MAG: DNA primase [Bacteroides sp.]|nr:DNA primase [Prevotella sp.]MCM1407896.1 DNA primase [Treponema brennaborense]MCM1469638.1 DNA primase [Bacteroides sp.]